jgi:hypothetical protein
MELPTLAPNAFLDHPLAIILSTNALIGILFLFILSYIGISSILLYHWNAYGMKSNGIIFAQSLYLLVSVVLLIVSGLAIYYY